MMHSGVHSLVHIMCNVDDRVPQRDDGDSAHFFHFVCINIIIK